jgi:uncharacterized protein YndB with AHSA1/START domain
MTQPFDDRFGYPPLPEMREVRASVEIEAPPEVVFRALADPRELVAWLGDMASSDAPSEGDDAHLPPSDPSREAEDGERDDAASSFTYPTGGAGWLAHVRAPDGTPGTVSGEFLYVVPSRSLTTTWSASWNRFAQEQVKFELVPIDVAGAPGTRVTVTHGQRRVMLVREVTIASAHTGANIEDDRWAAVLARLAMYVATRNALASSGIASGDLAQAFGALHRRVVAIHQGESA